jgi:FkbM family methyltransferase
MAVVRQLVKGFVALPLRLLPRDASIRILSGELRGWRWIAESATNGCWAGTYERPVQELFRRHVRPGSVVLDVGANVGFYTLLASKLVGPAGHVHAFEPLPRNLHFLEKHVELNGLSNVTVQPIAISALSGHAQFHTTTHASMGRLGSAGDLDVVTASLDDLLASGRIPLPTFIKMDIEGAESGALRGAATLLSQSPLTIVLSTHGYEQHELCWSILTSAGFDLQLARDGADDGDYLIVGTK